jgi:predicted RND superfamily exporter protein
VIWIRVFEVSDSPGEEKRPLWEILDWFTTRRGATAGLGAAAILGAIGVVISHDLKIGDLDAGAPELRPDSRYNRDVAFMNRTFGASSDVFAVMISTPNGNCSDFAVLNRIDALEWRLRALPRVESTNSLALVNRNLMVSLNEGYGGWYDLSQNQLMVNRRGPVVREWPMVPGIDLAGVIERSQSRSWKKGNTSS